MKTLKEIRDKGDIAAYMRDLATATREILPSMDGSPDNRCHMALVIWDEDGLVDFITDVKGEEAAALLRAAALRIETGAYKIGKPEGK